MDHELANSTDLDQWADRRASHGVLPRLVRELVFGTGKGLSRVCFRADEGIALPGEDGTVHATQNDVHVPKGDSVWELGANTDIRGKAESDFRKRTEALDNGEISPATFIFVTPRRWSGKKTWILKKQKENRWREVRVYDADDLATWLGRVPSVHLWISEHLGKHPSEARSLELWWQAWAEATKPALSPELLLAGRQEAANRVRALALGPNSVGSISGDSQEEVLAFIASALILDSGIDGPATLSRALTVSSARAWNRLARAESPLILLPLFERPDVSSATKNGHSVLIPFGQETRMQSTIELPRLRRKEIEAVLVNKGVGRERASDLATLCRRSVMAFRRTLAISPESQVPLWSKPEHVRDLLPAILAGMWIEGSEGDQASIEHLAGIPYLEYSRLLTRWAQSSDPPVRRIGTLWIITSRVDSWALSARFLTEEDIRRFKEIALRVLGSDEPSLDLPLQERYMGVILGKTRPFSGKLMTGLAETLAIMATFAEGNFLALDLQSEPTLIVRQLLESCNSDPTGRRWNSIVPILPLVAEAAPDVFLGAVESGSRGKAAVLGHLFQDSTSHFPPSSNHPSLLFALETLAWSPDHVSRALLALVRLSEIDPGGQLLNRPGDSVIKILFLINPENPMSIEERLQRVDLIRRRFPSYAWGLMLSLIPTRSGILHPMSAPRWRQWKSKEFAKIVHSDLIQAIERLVTFLLEDVGNNADRWTQLLDRLDLVQPKSIKAILKALSELDVSSLNSKLRKGMLQALRQFVAQYESDKRSSNVTSEDILKVKAQVARFESGAPSERYERLFRHEALLEFKLPDGTYDNASYTKAQAEAMDGIYRIEKLSGIFEWIDIFAERPHQAHPIGWTLGKIQITTDDENIILTQLLSPDPARRTLANGYVRGRVAMEDGKMSWVKLIHQNRVSTWSEAERLAFFLAIPATPELWDLVESSGVEIERRYWKDMNYRDLPEELDSYILAAEKLADFGLAHIALKLLDQYGTKGSWPAELSMKLLEALVENPPPLLESRLTHHIRKHLRHLQECDFDEPTLARLEWRFLLLFRYEDRPFGILDKLLCHDPNIFVQMLSLARPLFQEEQLELQPMDSCKAEAAYSLLSSWELIPGAQPDGAIDAQILRRWVEICRSRLIEIGMGKIGDSLIGGMLFRGASREEGASWPAVEIRDLIEEISSDDLEDGFKCALFNSRGVTTRGMTEGGVQEREAALPFKRHSEASKAAWPRTASMLSAIAIDFERKARNHDLRAETTEDLWS